MDKLQEEVSVDYLTGLYNRRFIEKIFKEEGELFNSHIALADIDFFKKINDTYGHDCGDYILKEISNLFKGEFKENNYICRWGGEEFLIYIKDSSVEEITDKLEEIRNTISERVYKHNGSEFSVTITFGVCKVDGSIEMDDNIKKADIALYYGKSNGRNRVVRYCDIEKIN